MKRLVPIFILLIAVGAYFAYRYVKSREPFEWSGTVEARLINVGSRTGGRVKEVLVREGVNVAAEQPLVVLEPGDLPAQLLAAQGQLEQATATLEKLEAGSRPEEIEQAKARAATANAALQESVAGTRQEEIAAANARLVATQAAVEKAQLDVDRARSSSRAAPFRARSSTPRRSR